MKPYYAIIFNGPPHSGKDHAAKLVAQSLIPAQHCQFKEHLFKLVLVIFNVTEEEFFSLYNNRETKEKPTCLLRGFSPREALIYVSEEVIKPKFGKQYFGEIAAENMCYGVNAFSDGGFLEELAPVYDTADGNLLIVRLHRPEYTFERFNDSRKYMEGYKDAKVVDLHNDSDLATFEVKVMDIVTQFLEEVNER